VLDDIVRGEAEAFLADVEVNRRREAATTGTTSRSEEGPD